MRLPLTKQKMINIPLTLEKAAMAFKLSDGTVLLISKEDANQIANSFITSMLINNRHQVVLSKDTAIEKSNLLYKIVIEQKERMSNEVKEQYLKAILELIKINEIEEVPFEKELNPMLKR